jgi:hypothetical protein
VRQRPPHQVFKPGPVPIFSRKVPTWLGVPLVGIYLLAAYRRLAALSVGRFFAIAIPAGCLILALGLAWAIVRVYRLSTALAVEGDRLVYRSWGRARSWPVEDVAKLVRGTVLIENATVPSYSPQVLMFISASGRCFLRLGPEWAQARIARALGMPIEPIDAGVTTAADAVRSYPGSFSWIVAHPWGRYLAGIATGFVLIIAIVLSIAWHLI